MECHNDIIERGESSNNVVMDNIGSGASNEPDSLHGGSLKRKRHNSNQLQELEAFFIENPRPDQKAMTELGNKLSMDGNQVKIWFQNKRNQAKLKSGHEEHRTLKVENAKLRSEHAALKEAMANPFCDRCGGQAIVTDIDIDEYQTRLENDRLKEAVKRINALAEEVRRTQDLYGGKL